MGPNFQGLFSSKKDQTAGDIISIRPLPTFPLAHFRYHTCPIVGTVVDRMAVPYDFGDENGPYGHELRSTYLMHNEIAQA